MALLFAGFEYLAHKIAVGWSPMEILLICPFLSAFERTEWAPQKSHGNIKESHVLTLHVDVSFSI